MPTDQVEKARDRVREIKLAYGGTEGTRLHCREMFAKDARAKSAWAHLTDEQAFAVCGEIARLVSSGIDWHRSVCVARKSDFPGPVAHWRQPGGPDAPREYICEMPMSDKWLEAQCSLGASIHVTYAPGAEIEFVADGDRTKIDTHAGQRQASSLVGGQVGHNADHKPRIAPTIRHVDKCELLEVADFMAYAAQRYWHLKSDTGLQAGYWRAWYKAFDFMFARYQVGPTGQFVVNVEGRLDRQK